MRKTTKGLVGGVMLAGGTVLARQRRDLIRITARVAREAGRRMRYLAGRLEGLSYTIEGRHPDPNVPDNVLADRIRSELGGLEKRRDLPHIHVMVENHVALLHGDVATDDDARVLEHAVAGVSGVSDVKSHLHVGLLNGETRPSQGRAQGMSPRGT
jgi:osmotically-inducible protein OsmY